jgi:Trk K+ transport system NAD-binding subunit
MLGQSLARRVNGSDARAHAIGHYGELLIAEATATGTAMVDKTLQEIGLFRELGLTVVGVWERGEFTTARPQTTVGANTVLVLAGNQEQMDGFDQRHRVHRSSEAPTVIIGGGRVGSAAARALSERGLRYRIVEQNPELVREPEEFVLGNAAELSVLQKAGIDQAPAVIITTHDDDMNVYLTIYCRRLRPDIQIITRVALERNISSLHRAGADFVMSYASMGANAVFNLLEGGGTLMVAEGLELFRVKMPASLAGQTIAESGIRRTTGCTVIALDSDGTTQINPDPMLPLPAGAEMILIGSAEDESRFLGKYVKD